MNSLLLLYRMEERVTKLQQRLDVIRDQRDVELQKGAARDRGLVESYDKAAAELLDEIKSLLQNPGEQKLDSSCIVLNEGHSYSTCVRISVPCGLFWWTLVVSCRGYQSLHLLCRFYTVSLVLNMFLRR